LVGRQPRQPLIFPKPPIPSQHPRVAKNDWAFAGVAINNTALPISSSFFKASAFPLSFRPPVRDLFICAKHLFVAARKGFASFTGNARSHAHEPPSAIRHCHCSKETAPRAAWRHRSPAWPRPEDRGPLWPGRLAVAASATSRNGQLQASRQTFPGLQGRLARCCASDAW